MAPKTKAKSDDYLGEPIGKESDSSEFDSMFSPENSIGKASESETSDVEPGVFQKAMNVLDIPGSIARTGLEAAISPERDVLSSVGKQISKTIESPTTAAASAPTGWDVAETAGTEMFGNEPKPEPQGFAEGAIRAAGEIVPGFAIEMATDPLGLMIGGAGKIKKAIRKPLLSASERQAVKAVARYSTKAGTISRGQDAEVIGARLVQDNLQGLLKNPQKLYEKMAGQRHITKTKVPGLEEYSIKRGPRQGGLIRETSDEVSSLIKTIEDDYGIKNIVPADIISDQIAKKIGTKMSQTSGETPDIGKIQEILNKSLKPYSTTPQVGGFGLMTQKTPNKLTLSELHELRKNIGKQVADRTFYAAPDQNMMLEKEVLAEAYRDLGDIIYNNLKGNPIIKGKDKVDAGELYNLQNEKLKTYLDLESMMEYVPTENLKDQDMLSLLASMGTKGAIWGSVAGAGALAGVPISAGKSAILGFGLGAGQAASEAVKSKAPEYLTDILKQAAKVAPAGAAVGQRGAIQFMREGEFVPESNMGRSPQSIPSPRMSPKEIINYRLPRSTQGILENKDKVLAKLVQNNVPDETIDAVAQALNGDPDQLSDIAPLLLQQFPTLFEKSKYMVFDGIFIDPNDKAKAADNISKRDDLNSIQRARMINKINKTGEVPEGL
jgi:hypothetical protein